MIVRGGHTISYCRRAVDCPTVSPWRIGALAVERGSLVTTRRISGMLSTLTPSLSQGIMCEMAWIMDAQGDGGRVAVYAKRSNDAMAVFVRNKA